MLHPTYKTIASKYANDRYNKSCLFCVFVYMCYVNINGDSHFLVKVSHTLSKLSFLKYWCLWYYGGGDIFAKATDHLDSNFALLVQNITLLVEPE